MNDKNEIILYQPDEMVKLEVRMSEETVWLTQQQMSILFGVKENNITYHIRGIYSSCELEPESTTQKIRVVRQEGNRKVTRQIDFYNLDMIISVGYRVNIFTQSHDRFLMIDNEVYHIGASIKDLGKKWFAFCKMELQANEILEKLSQI